MSFRRARSRRLPAESGQAFIIIAILMAAFLIGMLGLTTDYTQLWAHRQMSQAAADAACQAGAADLFLQYENDTAPGIDFSWIGTAYTCNANPTSPPCQ